MSHLQFLSREKLVAYLEEELRLLLNQRGLYEIDQYGWLVDGTYDPEFQGHAVWQDQPPGLLKLTALGEGFADLMRSARHSLGLASLFHEGADTVFGDHHGFCCHYADAVNKLNLASDRIRDFLITAFVRQAPWGAKSWPVTSKVLRGVSFYNNFLHPFEQIKAEVDNWTTEQSPLRECLSKLQPLADKAAGYRTENQDPGRHLRFFQERFAVIAANLAMGYPDEALPESLAQDEDRSLLDSLSSWYTVLIELSNQVFLAEHLLRSSAKELTTTGRRPAREQIL